MVSKYASSRGVLYVDLYEFFLLEMVSKYASSRLFDCICRFTGYSQPVVCLYWAEIQISRREQDMSSRFSHVSGRMIGYSHRFSHVLGRMFGYSHPDIWVAILCRRPDYLQPAICEELVACVTTGLQQLPASIRPIFRYSNPATDM
ncbi:hypothetical protein TB2_025524 [Malus domestica]